MAKASDVMQAIVDRLIGAMEAGPLEWRMPWRAGAAGGMPVNGVANRAYRGGNVIQLWMQSIDRGYADCRWATYGQWESVGGQVRKGEKSTPVVLWKPVELTDADGDKTGERWITRSFNVFNAAQCDGVQPIEVVPPVDPPAAMAAFVAATGANVVPGKPSYSPHQDVVRMLPVESFNSIEAWFGTMVHELAHWTGHESRLAREYGKRFGDDAYAAEELVAELSSAFTCGLFGVASPDRSDHASYLQSWIRVLKAEPAILWTVSSKAAAATDHLVSLQPTVVPA